MVNTFGILELSMRLISLSFHQIRTSSFDYIVIHKKATFFRAEE